MSDVDHDELIETFREAGGTTEEVAGHEVVVRVAGLDEEYRAIREGIGVWDHSDTTKVRVAGAGAMDLLSGAVTGNVENLPENAVRHTLLLDDDGAIVTDLHVHNDFDRYIVTCEADRGAALLAALRGRAGGDVEVEDVSGRYAALVVEGPQAWRVPRDLVGPEATGVRLLNFLECSVEGGEGFFSRIGSSGEYGYVFWLPPGAAAGLLRRIREAFPEAVLCGREVQDLLKLEVRAFNRDRDIVRGESALEAGLHWMIDFHKDDHVGAGVLRDEQERGLDRKLVAFRVVDGGEAPRLSDVLYKDTPIGYVANAARSPRLDAWIGLAYLDVDFAWVGLELGVAANGTTSTVETVSAPFFLTESNRVQMS